MATRQQKNNNKGKKCAAMLVMKKLGYMCEIINVYPRERER